MTITFDLDFTWNNVDKVEQIVKSLESEGWVSDYDKIHTRGMQLNDYICIYFTRKWE